ncbi:MAG: lipoyl protein ligase domain-containing protein [Cyanobium sp.]
MALDQLLLESSLAAPQGAPSLRLYRWSRPTLSLGHHQRQLPPQWHHLASSGAIDLVRRPSGGRAVLHGGDLTYALIWPAAGQQRRRTYGLACGWLCRAFAELGMPLHFGRQAASRDRASCFATSTRADLVHRHGAKRIGSAQFWSRGTLLQHGSIQIDPPADLWRGLFAEEPPDLPPLPLGDGELEAHLRRCAARYLPAALRRGLPAGHQGDVVERALTPAELERSLRERDRYRVPALPGDAAAR